MNDLLSKIDKALNDVRPFLEEDGGNVKVVEVTEDFTLKLEFTGACGSCPMSPMTFKNGIEETILKNVPEIKRVEAVNIA